VQAARREVHSYLLASAFTGRLRLLHLFLHLRLDGLEVEARAPLHRRIVEEALKCLGLVDWQRHGEIANSARFRFACPISWPISISFRSKRDQFCK